MFDARYHALSLAAVLLSLVIGLLLGVAIGDEGLVSSAENNLRQGLRGDLRDAREETRDVRARLNRRDAYERQTFPVVVADRQQDRRVSLLFLDERSESAFTHVRDAVDAAGAELSLVAVLRETVDAAALAGTTYEDLQDAEPERYERFGRRLGRELVRGGRLLRQVRQAVLASSAGELGGAEGVVIVRGEPRQLDGDDRARRDAFQRGLLTGLGAFQTPVVGVELTSTDPSQTPWYREHGLASVDNVDETAGRASLVFALAGAADGAYGIKPTAQSLLPEALTERP